jgi:hypothetical protein
MSPGPQEISRDRETKDPKQVLSVSATRSGNGSRHAKLPPRRPKWISGFSTGGASPSEAPPCDLDPIRPGSQYVFFGFETDTALASYLYTVIDRAVITETAAFKQLNPRFRGVRLRQASASFQHGVVARVAERLDAIHSARDAAVRAHRSTGTALIVAKNRIVEDAFRETDVRLVSMSAMGLRVIASAFRAGWDAGDRVNLNRPVVGDTARLLV